MNYKILAGYSSNMSTFFLILDTSDDEAEGIIVQVELGELLIKTTTKDWRDLIILDEKPTKAKMLVEIFKRHMKRLGDK